MRHPEAEISIVSQLIHYQRCREPVFERLRPGDFESANTRQLFESLRTLYLADEPLENHELAAPEINGTLLPWHVAVPKLIECAQRRATHRAGMQAVSIAQDAEIEIDEVRSQLSAIVAAAEDDRSLADSPTLHDVRISFDRRLEALRDGRDAPVRWGLDVLERAPLRPGYLCFIAARPAVGKTALACTCALDQARHGIPVGIFCFEMESEDLFARFVCIQSGVSFELLMSSNAVLTEQQSQRVEKAKDYIETLPIYLECGAGKNPNQIRQITTEWTKRYGVKLVYIDYLQRIHHERDESMYVRVGKTSTMLKDMALELRIPVICLAQLNREADNARPALAHLRESGNIEQDADIVLLLDRPDAWGEDAKSRGYVRKYSTPDGQLISDNNMAGRCAVNVAKQRNGPTGIVFIEYSAETMHFYCGTT